MAINLTGTWTLFTPAAFAAKKATGTIPIVAMFMADPLRTGLVKSLAHPEGLLHMNGIIGAQDAMNAQTLPQVKMPNRDNFIVVYPTKPE